MKRGPGKIKSHCNLKDAYRTYKKESSIPNDKKYSYQKYRNFINELNSRMFKEAIEKSMIIKLPWRLGKIKVIKYKPIMINKKGEFCRERLKINWKATKDYWLREYPDKTLEEIYKIPGKIKIYHDNPHTDGYQHTFHWEKAAIVNFPGKSAYQFKSTRYWKRYLNTHLRNPNRKNDFYMA